MRVYASGSPVSVLQVLCSCACKSISGVLSADMFGSDRDLICFFGMRSHSSRALRHSSQIETDPCFENVGRWGPSPH